MTIAAPFATVPLKRLIASIASGVSVNATDVSAEPGQIGVLKTSCVYTGTFDPSENKTVVPDELERVACPVLAGTLVVSRMNTPDLVGAAGLVGADAPGIYLPDRLWQVSFDREAAEPRFVYWWTRSELYREQVKMACAGASSSMQNLDQGSFRTFDVPRQSLAQQERIANFLDVQTARIDSLIAGKEQLVDSLRAYQFSYSSRLMTRGMDESVKTSATSFPEIGAVPSHWTVKRLKFLGEVRSGVAKGKDIGGKDTVRLPYLRVANVQAGYVDLSEVSEIDVAESDAARYLLRNGDVLMNEGGDNDKLGRGAVWQGQIDPCIHQNHVFAVRLGDLGLATWVSDFTSTDAARAYFFLRSKQSTNLASINQSNVLELPVPMPPEDERLELQAELQRVNRATSDLVSHAVEHIGRLREFRSSLISAAVTGQIDINTYGATPA